MATELGGTQVTSLMETLPGIASVLRNPVADAFGGLIRAAAGLGEFRIGDAEEILRYAVRRTLMTQDETDRVLEEVRLAQERALQAKLEKEREKEKVKIKKASAPAAKAKAKASSASKKPASKAKKKK